MNTTKIKNELENLFEKYGYDNCDVKEVVLKKNHILIICTEYNPFSKSEEFTIEYKNERFYNVHGDDLEESYIMNA